MNSNLLKLSKWQTRGDVVPVAVRMTRANHPHAYTNDLAFKPLRKTSYPLEHIANEL